MNVILYAVYFVIKERTEKRHVIWETHIFKWITSLVRCRPDFEKYTYCWVFETNSWPQEITRNEIIFPYQEDMVHIYTHMCRVASSGKCGTGYFPSGKKTFASALNLRWIILQWEIRTLLSIYRIDSRKGWGWGWRRGKAEGVASGYTSDKWWIGNKWGILTGNIRDIKKEPHAPPSPISTSRIERDWNLTLSYYPNWTKGTFDGDMEYSRDTTHASPRKSVSGLGARGKKKRKPEYTYVIRDICMFRKSLIKRIWWS